MIYDAVTPDQPLSQGDILYPVPMVTVPSLDNILNLNDADDPYKVRTWSESQSGSPIVSPLPIENVWGIVCSQTCDASRSPVISCFQIDTFSKVTGLLLPEKPNKRASLIVSQSRQNGKWFYLPAFVGLGFTEPMAVRFDTVFQIHRESLMAEIGKYRGCRLNTVAYEHYRESIAQYFRRYPYDEWYPLAGEELNAYQEGIKDPLEREKVKLFEWQK